MTWEEIAAIQKRAKAFQETELGKLFSAFDRAHSHAWIVDTGYGFGQNVSMRRMDEAWEAEKATRKALVDKLMELAGMPAP